MTTANHYESGATTLAANNLVLTVENDGDTYEDRLHAGFAMLQGTTHRGMNFRDFAEDEARRQRAQGSRIKPAEISEAGRILQRDQLANCIERMRDGRAEGEKIAVFVRRWFDRVNGNSYWSARIVVPQAEGADRWFAIPLSYGHGSQIEFDVAEELAELDLIPAADRDTRAAHLEFHDEGERKRRDLYDGVRGLAFYLNS